MNRAEREQGEKVRKMFDDLAPRYDRMNRIMTLGRDRHWRRFVVDRVRLKADGTVLDLATGTGDIALEIQRRHPAVRVFAGDFSSAMLQNGRRRKGGSQLFWVACDAGKLPFADDSFHAVTFGYLLRNVTDIDRVLTEVRRVLKPGGQVVCLDTSPPPPRPWRPLLRVYLRYGLPLLGRLFAGRASSYAYLSQSTLAFHAPDELKAIFERNGFVDVAFRRFMFQTIAVHWGRKAL